MRIVVWLVVSLLFMWSCQEGQSPNRSIQTSTTDEDLMTTPSKDIHSYAEPDQAIMQHLVWKARVDFDSMQITAKASIKILRDPTARFIVLDTKNLDIERVTLGEEKNEIRGTFELGNMDPVLGSPLRIPLLKETEWVNIYYRTTDGAQALQWLQPQQTSGKIFPFLFTQSQAILARSWIPLQDSPGIRFTYEAEVQVPNNLLALMSAENPQVKNPQGVYHFKMEQPIPAYLMSLAVGDVQFQTLGPRTGVYAEGALIEKARYEFAEIESMISKAEQLYGPYQWGRYDLIVLPPSFPFGGMENPRLTFATPTILAGDRSLTSLVAHELAHSWSGNLVTNATWEDFWLNEGFTVYFEHRIMEALYGRDYSEMLALLALQDLKQEVKDMLKQKKAKDTMLKLDLKNRNPDEAVTAIAYDKGYFFLRWLEERVGRQQWDKFLRDYFQANAFHSITTAQFLHYLQKNLIEKDHINIYMEDVDQWIYKPGLPDFLHEPQSDRFKLVEESLRGWHQQGKPMENTGSWTTQEWLHLIKNLPSELDSTAMAALDKQFDFTHSGNSEIQAAWYQKAILHNYRGAYGEMENFMMEVGRRKFLVPLYRTLASKPQGLSLAREIYRRARPNYHFVATNSIDQILQYPAK